VAGHVEDTHHADGAVDQEAAGGVKGTKEVRLQQVVGEHQRFAQVLGKIVHATLHRHRQVRIPAGHRTDDRVVQALVEGEHGTVDRFILPCGGRWLRRRIGGSDTMRAAAQDRRGHRRRHGDPAGAVPAAGSRGNGSDRWAVHAGLRLGFVQACLSFAYTVSPVCVRPDTLFPRRNK